jgi:rhodanese-related sulfurtransferase
LNERSALDELQIIDVRRPGEYNNGHVPRALNAPLSGIEKQISQLTVDKDKETFVICAGGYRSSAAASLMQKHGFTNLINVTGGTNAWIGAGYPVERSE